MCRRCRTVVAASPACKHVRRARKRFGRQRVRRARKRSGLVARRREARVRRRRGRSSTAPARSLRERRHRRRLVGWVTLIVRGLARRGPRKSRSQRTRLCERLVQLRGAPSRCRLPRIDQRNEGGWGSPFFPGPRGAGAAAAGPPPDPLNPPGGPIRPAGRWCGQLRRYEHGRGARQVSELAGWLSCPPSSFFGSTVNGSGFTKTTSGHREGTASSLHRPCDTYPSDRLPVLFPALELGAAVKSLCRTAHVTLMPRHFGLRRFPTQLS